jgi:hypothetical protein
MNRLKISNVIRFFNKFVNTAHTSLMRVSESLKMPTISEEFGFGIVPEFSQIILLMGGGIVECLVTYTP